MKLTPLPLLSLSLLAGVSFSFFCLNHESVSENYLSEKNLNISQTQTVKDDLNIFFAVNDGYAKQLCVTIVSILANNQNETIHFYVLSNDFSEANKHAVQNIYKLYKNWDITYLQPDRKLFENLNLTVKYITIETYYRYVIAQMLPNLDKGLYLDADLAVNGSLRELWDTPLDGYYCAGVSDLCIERLKYKGRIGLLPSDLYINGGMLLLNLKQIRQDKMTEKLFENTVKMSGKIFYQDQDIINITFKDKIKEVDSVYNFTSDNLKKEKFKASRAVVIHYTGATKKPWKEECRSKLQYVWQCYALLNDMIQRMDETELAILNINSCLSNKKSDKSLLTRGFERIKQIFFR